jgi:hypothetical protein
MRSVWGCGRVGRLAIVGVVVVGGSLASGSVALATTPCPGASSSSATQCVFNTAGSSFFTVPGDVTSVDVVAVGGAGASSGSPGGLGASVEDTSVPVTGGQVLTVDVGGVGSGPGSGGTAGVDGAGGGYSGVLDTSSLNPLVVAGGGGGGGNTAGGNADTGSGGGSGGDFTIPAGSCDGYIPGEGCVSYTPSDITVYGGGGGVTNADGTCTGGTGGAPGGGDGSSLQGGSGGSVTLPGFGSSGGGGGGGGYCGGGGGGVFLGPGAGGGGGSSYGVSGLTNEQVASGPASVTINWVIPVPAASTSTQKVSFATQAQATLSPPRPITITDTGTAPLQIAGFVFSGVDNGDFLIASDNCRAQIAPGGDCVVNVSFAPQGQGARAATLEIESNDPNSPTDVALTGSGGLGTVVCKNTAAAKALCSIEFPAGTWTVQSNGQSASFAIDHAGRVVVRGKVRIEHGGLSLPRIRGLHRGKYLLIVTIGNGRQVKVLVRRTFVVR